MVLWTQRHCGPFAWLFRSRGVFWTRDEKRRLGTSGSYWEDRGKERKKKTKSWLLEGLKRVGWSWVGFVWATMAFPQHNSLNKVNLDPWNICSSLLMMLLLSMTKKVRIKLCWTMSAYGANGLKLFTRVGKCNTVAIKKSFTKLFNAILKSL